MGHGQLNMRSQGSHKTKLPSDCASRKTVPLGEYSRTPCKGAQGCEPAERQIPKVFISSDREVMGYLLQLLPGCQLAVRYGLQHLFRGCGSALQITCEEACWDVAC